MHDDVIKWKHFPRYWPFVRGIHRSPVNSPHKGQWHGALMFSLICTRINGWVNNGEAGDLRRYRAHCDVTVMGPEMFNFDWIDLIRVPLLKQTFIHIFYLINQISKEHNINRQEITANAFVHLYCKMYSKFSWNGYFFGVLPICVNLLETNIEIMFFFSSKFSYSCSLNLCHWILLPKENTNIERHEIILLSFCTTAVASVR